jgi:hypothetical protein
LKKANMKLPINKIMVKQPYHLSLYDCLTIQLFNIQTYNSMTLKLHFCCLVKLHNTQ